MMDEGFPQDAQKIMDERFKCDSLIALATVDDNVPCVRAVNSYYEEGAFYVITHAKSGKMKQIERNNAVAICGDWFTAHGTGENLGHILDEKNAEIADKLRTAFAEWYHNGHTNEADPNTCILCIHLTDGVLFSHGTKYNIDFTEEIHEQKKEHIKKENLKKAWKDDMDLNVIKSFNSEDYPVVDEYEKFGNSLFELADEV